MLPSRDRLKHHKILAGIDKRVAMSHCSDLALEWERPCDSANYGSRLSTIYPPTLAEIERHK